MSHNGGSSASSTLPASVRMAVSAFAGDTSAFTNARGIQRAKDRLTSAVRKKRLDSRYFQGEFYGPAIHQNRKMHLIAHHNMHDHLIDTSSSHVSKTIEDHLRVTRRAREQFANNTYKEEVREARNKIIDQDNELLLRGLFNVAKRRNEYNDALFLERVDRITRARDIARKNAQDWKVRGINRENQEILGRLCGTTSAYDSKGWERDFQRHKHNVKMCGKVKRVKSRKARHSKGFDASSSKADRDSGKLLPDYDHVRDRACLTYTQSKAFRRNKARHDRVEKRIERDRNRKEKLRRQREMSGRQGMRPGTY